MVNILSCYPIEKLKSDLNTFSYIVMIEKNELNYEKLLIYIYIYIINFNFNRISKEFQRRTHLERRNFMVNNHKLYKKSSYELL